MFAARVVKAADVFQGFRDTERCDLRTESAREHQTMLDAFVRQFGTIGADQYMLEHRFFLNDPTSWHLMRICKVEGSRTDADQGSSAFIV